ncbi:hypothetical protein ECZU51_02880 [Escherichia coli]|nr:hypothetical protein ECZU51_02880 [Escherichia coli]
MAKTLYEKLFDAHVVYEAENETPLLYIDRHLVHEVTSPQAFDGLRAHGRPVRQPQNLRHYGSQRLYSDQRH